MQVGNTRTEDGVALEETRSHGSTHLLRLRALSSLALRWSRDSGFACLLSPDPDFEVSWPSPREAFTAIVVLELVGDADLPATFRRTLVDYVSRSIAPSGFVHFFEDRGRLPADVDCTSVAASGLWRAGGLDPRTLRTMASKIADNTARGGEIQVYVDPNGDRDQIVDPVVCLNALHAIHLAGLADRAVATEDYVHRCLCRGSLVEGSRYYVSEDTALYFASRLTSDFPDRLAHWVPLLRRLVRRRLDAPGTVIEVAQRAIAARRLDIAPGALHEHLLGHAFSTDGWRPGPFFRFGRRRIYFGSPTLTAAFVARALDRSSRRFERMPPGSSDHDAPSRHHPQDTDGTRTAVPADTGARG